MKGYQMSENMPCNLIYISSLGKSVLPTYLVIVHCTSKYGICIISREVLSKAVHVNTQVIKMNLCKLINCGAIALLILKESTNAIMLNPNIIWHKGLDNHTREELAKRYRFPQNIINPSLVLMQDGLLNAQKHSDKIVLKK